MPLNRNERTTALTYLLEQNYPGFGRLIEETNNLSQPQKIDLLSSALQLASPEARITYAPETKRVIADIVGVLNAERNIDVVSQLA